ncbi:hypothetical protein GQ54DRAFT_98790 [Martensiomyces pterosporus]|nr:hypothetical protein GQ54DRAFT_98790 [Martensiomyces pterosporus]
MCIPQPRIGALFCALFHFTPGAAVAGLAPFLIYAQKLAGMPKTKQEWPSNVILEIGINSSAIVSACPAVPRFCAPGKRENTAMRSALMLFSTISVRHVQNSSYQWAAEDMMADYKGDIVGKNICKCVSLLVTLFRYKENLRPRHSRTKYSLHL